MIVGVVIFISILVIGSILLLAWPKLSIIFEKKHYKKSMNHLVYSISRDSDFYLLNKIHIPIEGGKVVHIDHIIFSDKFIYCIGDAYYDGPLSGKYLDQSWFKYDNLIHFEHVKNPLNLHHTRLRYLISETGAPEDLFVGIIVVPDSCFLDKIQGVPKSEFICRQSELKNIIMKKEKEQISNIDPIQLNSLVHNIYDNFVKDN